MRDRRSDGRAVSAAMQEADFGQLVELAGDAIVVSDARGIITVWNQAAERIFGFAKSDAIGRSLDIITPERQRARHWEGYEKTVRSGVTRYGTTLLKVPALHQDGRTLSIAFTVGLLFDEKRDVMGVTAIIRDETARWQEERQTRRRLAELEAGLAEKAGT